MDLDVQSEVRTLPYGGTVTTGNLRFHLYAFELTDSCRLAWLVYALTSETESKVSRDEVAGYWAQHYPEHNIRKRKTIRNRMSAGLAYMRIANVLGADEQTIVVINRPHLYMAAANLAIVEDANDKTVAPERWIRRPCVPEYLQGVQVELEEER